MTEALKNIGRYSQVGVPAPQIKKAAPGQKKNSAGGFTFKISDLERAKRFLILGSDANYYKSAAKLSKDNAKVIIKLAESDSRTLVDLIVEVSKSGRAPKQQPGLFALAIAASYGSAEDRSYALQQLPVVARTASSLFTFVGYALQFRKWGSALPKAVAKWYTSKDVDKLAYQMVKYRERDGWTHGDLARVAHPYSDALEFDALMEWALGKPDVLGKLPAVVRDFEEAKKISLSALPALIRSSALSWEMIPTEALNDPKVWDALLDGNLPLGALIRQLPRLTRIGVISPLGGRTADIVARLTDQDALVKARIHPLNILIALKTYAAGKSVRGDSTWQPNNKIIDALDEAFYLSFKSVVPSGKRFLIGLDVSGSMGYGSVAGVEGITAREATAAISLVIAATEPQTYTIGFTGGSGYYWRRPTTASTSSLVTELNISPKQRLDDVVKKISNLPYGSTDCALPMLYAMEKGLKVDTFLVMTDNETWAGSVHPFEALKQYRAKTGIDAKLIVMSTEATKFSIADSDDPGMLDIPGFDSAAPALVTEFSRGL